MGTETLYSSNIGFGGSRSGTDGFDRWIFPFMTMLLLATVLAGFIPASIEKIAAVEAGERAPFLPILHVHALLMGSWILLLLVQSSLIASNNKALHMKLGMVSLALVPAMVIAGFILVPANMGVIWNLDPLIVPPPVIAETKMIVANIAILQIRVGILFPIMVAIALYYRTRDPGTHKRLMILATVLPIPAAIDRILWLPNTMPDSPIATELYTLMLILPMFAYDLTKRSGVPRAYLIWLAGWLPSSIIISILWSSEWWLSFAPRLMGMES